MALTVKDLPSVNALADETTRITQALAALSGPNPVITVEVSVNGIPGAKVALPIDPATLTTLLNSRKTVLQNQLTALGVSQ